MAGLIRDNIETQEGKYPIVLRRDGSALQHRYFVLCLHDPAAETALRAYADGAEACDMDPKYVAGVRRLADTAHRECIAAGSVGAKPSDPDGGPLGRRDHPAILAWANSIGCPGG